MQRISGLVLVLGFCSAPLLAVLPSTGGAGRGELPVVLKEDFTKGADRWQPFDPTGWKVDTINGKHLYNQFKSASSYKPPYRSPYNISLLKGYSVGTFRFDADVKSTIKDYPHRDTCVVFGYQDPGHFYYVHFGRRMDNYANQIFIVNGAARTKISTKTNPGTPWTDDWHHVRVVRDAGKGKIEVFFDDMKNPAMTAADTTFTWGRIGVGSFDDTSMWTDVVLRGVRAEKK
jgi:hypothetical protein